MARTSVDPLQTFVADCFSRESARRHGPQRQYDYLVHINTCVSPDSLRFLDRFTNDLNAALSRASVPAHFSRSALSRIAYDLLAHIVEQHGPEILEQLSSLKPSSTATSPDPVQKEDRL